MHLHMICYTFTYDMLHIYIWYVAHLHMICYTFTYDMLYTYIAASLASLIYQHTLTPLALPCKLLLPDPGKN